MAVQPSARRSRLAEYCISRLALAAALWGGVEVAVRVFTGEWCATKTVLWAAPWVFQESWQTLVGLFGR